MKITYRPEIDGLRAIAVCSVIFYHSQLNVFGYQIFKGGFIGVDIFFVISGYLITSIILKELVTTGSFSFKYFYERRIRRILPILLLVTLATCLVSSFLMMPTLINEVQKQSLSSIFFISNFKFLFDLTQYQSTSSNYIPLLHTWSLSIEEQFYLIFPLLLFLIFSKFRKYLVLIFLIILLLSLSFSEWASNDHKIQNFYFSFSRAWELLFGSLCAFIKKKNITFFKDYYFLNNLGIPLILISFYIFDDSLRHPSIFTLLPVIGTCFLILFDSKNYKDTFTKKILRSRILVGIGLISYSLYLWHYPFLVYFNILELLPVYKFIYIILIFIISFFSYKFVEKPFRNFISYRKVIFLISSLIILIISTNIILISKPVNLKKFTYEDNILDNRYLLEKSDSYADTIKKNFLKDKVKVLIFGDSHAKDLFISLNLNSSLFQKYDFKLIENSTYCLYEYFIKNKFCGKDVSATESSLLEDFDYIILKELWSHNEVDVLSLNLNFLKERFPNKKIIVIGNGPSFETKKYQSLVSTLYDQSIIKKENLSKSELERRYYKSYISFNDGIVSRELSLKVKKISEKFGVINLNQAELICNDLSKRCKYLTDNNKKIFYDYGHYTLEGAEYLGRKIYETNWLKLE
ncbi:acyltransferase family protein [Candidatus Pelagibacter sp.]|nr:acyltransferase family protein [Candidatus Pelagibacter sp.]